MRSTEFLGRLYLNFSLFIALLVATAHAQAPLAPIPPVPPIMISIADCESGDQQYNADGTVLQGRINPNDIGLFQINSFYHLKEAQAVGDDIYTAQGNIAFALYLYQHYGTQPWKDSEWCWGKKGG